MDLQIDPQVLIALAPVIAAAAEREPLKVGDVPTRRVYAKQTFDYLTAQRPPVAGVDLREYSTTTEDGATLSLSWYHRPGAAQPGSAALYLHGGGMIFGPAEGGPWYDSAIRGYVANSGVPILMVDYRIAPEFPHPVPVDDCYAALLWLGEHARELGVDPARVAVMGDSAGSGLPPVCACSVVTVAGQRSRSSC